MKENGSGAFSQLSGRWANETAVAAQGLVLFLHLEHNRRNVLQPHREIWEVTLLQWYPLFCHWLSVLNFPFYLQSLVLLSLWLSNFIFTRKSVHFCAVGWLNPVSAVQSSSGSVLLYRPVPEFLKELVLLKSCLLFPIQLKARHHSLEGMKISLLLCPCCTHPLPVPACVGSWLLPQEHRRDKRRRADIKSSLWMV